MAKAQFHKNQRVYVVPVGTWALVERVIPHWAKGLDEPIRIFYDVGLGREFLAEELESEGRGTGVIDSKENWRLVRARNKWQSEDECGHHPYPGTYPTVVTGDSDWGGWRVSAAEYDLDPQRIETQARIFASSLKLLSIVQDLIRFVTEERDVPDDLRRFAKDGTEVVKYILQERDHSPTGDLGHEEDVDTDVESGANAA
jgi:hypothetical protein